MINGPSLRPTQGRVEHLVVLLHGYGTNGEDLLSLGHSWRKYLPQAEFIAPHAPFACENSPFFGRQWFDISHWTPESLLAGAKECAPYLNEFLDATLSDRGLRSEDLALAGFSQGTMMALHCALSRPAPCAGVLGYSGALLIEDAQVKSKPPVLLIHGEEDHVVDFYEMERASNLLHSWKVPVETRARPGMGHGIDEESVSLGGHFLQQALQHKNERSAALR